MTLYFFLLPILCTSLGAVLSIAPVPRIFFLMATFAQGAAWLIYHNAAFLGFLIFIVYIGALIVLFLFIVMMIPQTIPRPKKITYLFHSIFMAVGLYPILPLPFIKILDVFHHGALLYTHDPSLVVGIGLLLFTAIVGILWVFALDRIYQKPVLSWRKKRTVTLHDVESKS